MAAHTSGAVDTPLARGAQEGTYTGPVAHMEHRLAPVRLAVASFVQEEDIQAPEARHTVAASADTSAAYAAGMADIRIEAAAFAAPASADTLCVPLGLPEAAAFAAPVATAFEDTLQGQLQAS